MKFTTLNGTKNTPSFMANSMALRPIATQGDKASVDMLLTRFPCNIQCHARKMLEPLSPPRLWREKSLASSASVCRPFIPPSMSLCVLFAMIFCENSIQIVFKPHTGHKDVGFQTTRGGGGGGGAFWYIWVTLHPSGHMTQWQLHLTTSTTKRRHTSRQTTGLDA